MNATWIKSFRQILVSGGLAFVVTALTQSFIFWHWDYLPISDRHWVKERILTPDETEAIREQAERETVSAQDPIATAARIHRLTLEASGKEIGRIRGGSSLFLPKWHPGFRTLFLVIWISLFVGLRMER